MLTAIDHVVIGVRDLDAAADRYARLLARMPSWRGEHPAFGTGSCLFRLDNAYVELLSPVAEGALAAALDRRLAERGDGLFALAFATDDAAAAALALRARGVKATDPHDGSGRDSTSGAVRHWRSVVLPETATRGLALFAIEHRSTDGALPRAGRDDDAPLFGIDHVVVSSADPDATAALFGDALGLRLALDRTFPERGLRLLFFRIGGVTLEVAARLGERPVAGADDRFFGLAYRAADAEAARRRLARAGFDVSEVRDGHKPGTRVCTVRNGTSGVPTLVIEPRLRATLTS